MIELLVKLGLAAIGLYAAVWVLFMLIILVGSTLNFVLGPFLRWQERQRFERELAFLERELAELPLAGATDDPSPDEVVTE